MAPVPVTQAIAFAAAEKRIWITNAYCTPTDDQVELLVKAVQRGVDVRIVLPGKNDDQPLTKSAGRAAYGKMLEGGVKIFEYQPTMIHTKSMVIDGLFALFGSSNFDSRSAEINEELDLAVYDEGIRRSDGSDLRERPEQVEGIHAAGFQESLALGADDGMAGAAVPLADVAVQPRAIFQHFGRRGDTTRSASVPSASSAFGFPAHRASRRFRRHPHRFVHGHADPLHHLPNEIDHPRRAPGQRGAIRQPAGAVAHHAILAAEGEAGSR